MDRGSKSTFVLDFNVKEKEEGKPFVYKEDRERVIFLLESVG